MPLSRRKQGIERRREKRAVARLSMRIEGVPVEGRLEPVVTESRNISASGVYFQSPHFLAPLTKVGMTIVLPRVTGGRGDELFRCDGIVVRCEPGARRADKGFEVACAFSNLGERLRGLLEEFVTWRNLQALRAAAAAAGADARRSARSGARRAPARAAAVRASTPASRAARRSTSGARAGRRARVSRSHTTR